MRRALPLLLLLAAALGGAELELTADPGLRAGLPWRVRVRWSAPVSSPGPLLLQGELASAGHLLGGDAVEIPQPAALAAGVSLVLVAAEVPDGVPVQAALRLVNGTGAIIASAVRSLPTPASLRAGLERQGGEQRALPWRRLALEQAAELLLPDPPTLGAMAAAEDRLRALERGRPPAGERAWIDAVDGSVQPWRLTLPPVPPRGIALLLRPLPGLRKCAWPPPPAPWLAAAAAAGMAVVEPYPAGDRDGHGVLARRAAALLVLAGTELPAGLPLHVVDPARGDPARAATWTTAPGLLPAPPAGHLAAWAGGPFVVVVGSSEHLAAARANRALAEAFVAAWAAHAHGIPPVVDERSFDPGRWRGHHLVLIGNPRSNRVAAAVLPALPLTWDDREVRWPQGASARSARAAVALCVPLAADRVALLLDGGPAWAPTGLPLADARGDWLVRGAGVAAGGALAAWDPISR